MALVLGQIGAAFVNPLLAAAGVAAVSIPIVIHLLWRLRRPPQPWGAMRFLMEAYRRHRSRLRLEQYALLVTRCLIVLLAGLALAGPILSGCAGRVGHALGAGQDGQARVVHLVLDDSLSAQTRTGSTAAARRWDHLTAAARSIVDRMRPGDRVALWRAAQPMEALVTPATSDHSRVLRALEQMTPRYTASQWTLTLGAVAQAIRDEPSDPRRTAVVLLSDFAAGSLNVEQAMPAEAAALGRLARVVVARPMEAASNTQIASMSPRRSVVLSSGAGGGSGGGGRPATTPVELRLRRFAASGAGEPITLELAVFAEPDQPPIWTGQRQVQWEAGQEEMTVSVEAVLETDQSAAGLRTIQARLPGDALASDDWRWTVVDLRNQVTVGLADAASLSAADSAASIEPRQWVKLALSPNAAGNSRSVLELVDLPASALEPGALATLDVLIILRPDLVTAAGWIAARGLLDRGGLLWLTAPAEGQPVAWGGALQEHLGLSWDLAGPQSLDASLGLVTTEPAPEPLRLLAADWPALLRPVRVTRWLELRTTQETAQPWMRLDDPQKSPLLAAARVGQGGVLLWTTAIDPAWTNLPTKPLFVPLLHESLRSLLGQTSSPNGSTDSAGVVCGEQPLLTFGWQGAGRLLRATTLPSPAGGEETTATRAETQAVQLERVEGGLRPIAALEEPGIYAAQPPTPRGRLAVNVVAPAGDTRAMDANRLEQWLGALGPEGPAGAWQWFDQQQPLAVLTQDQPRTQIGWPLLWVVLALVVVETLLARWFSHAREGHKAEVRSEKSEVGEPATHKTILAANTNNPMPGNRRPAFHQPPVVGNRK